MNKTILKIINEYSEISNKNDELASMAIDELIEIEQLASRRLELLRRLEWDDYDDIHDQLCCSICKQTIDDGHTEDCELARELEGIGGEEQKQA